MKEGNKSSTPETHRPPESYLDSAQDWTLKVDAEKQLKIPIEVTITNLRPDIILISETTKQLGAIELTVPSEERIELSGELKRAKYEKLVEEGKRKGGE